MRLFYLLIALLVVAVAPAVAAAPALVVSAGGAAQQFAREELLARPDAATLAVSNDPAYGAMRYRAVPLRALLSALPSAAGNTIQARATDGFVAEIPRTQIDGLATPWIAVEDPAHPWPNLRGKTVSAGPFYLIWQDPERAQISPEQWAYSLAALAVVPSPIQRWPAIAVNSSVPEDSPVRRGQAAFITNCLPCHRLAGAGEGVMGPDLLRPMPATAYFTEPGLRALIRDPAAVRTWPASQMPAFDATFWRLARSMRSSGISIIWLTIQSEPRPFGRRLGRRCAGRQQLPSPPRMTRRLLKAIVAAVSLGRL